VLEHRHLFGLTFTLASLIFKGEAEREWLKWRFLTLKDLLKESWGYKFLMEMYKNDIKRDLRAEMLTEDEAEKEAKELAEVLRRDRQKLLGLIELRFPELIDEARERAELINDPEVCHAFFLMLLKTPDAEEARRYLMEVTHRKNGH
jgi:hypothetical protein